MSLLSCSEFNHYQDMLNSRLRCCLLNRLDRDFLATGNFLEIADSKTEGLQWADPMAYAILISIFIQK